MPGRRHRGVIGAMRALNLSTYLLDRAPRAWDDRPALRFPGGSWTYAELRRRTGAAAGALARHGVRPGSRVAVSLPEGPEWVAVFLAAVRRGAVCAGLSPHLVPDARRHALDGLQPDLVLDDPERAAALTTSGASDPGPEPVGPDDPCYLLLTSGSTGPGKWAVHRHGDIPWCVATYGRRVLHLRPGDVTASVASLASSYGLGNSLYFPLAAGACAWLDPAVATPAGMARAGREGANVLFGVPTSWARLARHAAGGRIDPGDLAGARLAVSAGEALPAAVWSSVRASVGLRLVNGLGSSEATNLYLSDHAGAPRPGTVGWPVAGFDLRLVTPGGTPAREGEEGELLVRGGSVMSGYLGDPAATARAVEDGWLRTGDLLVREADGSHTFLGRAGDRFKAGGLWVDPVAVQEEILREPDVAGAIVLGVEDDDDLVRVVAVVAPASRPWGDLAEELPRRLAGRLPAHQIPRAVALVDELPTAPNGKVRRAEARRLAREALRPHTTTAGGR